MPQLHHQYLPPTWDLAAARGWTSPGLLSPIGLFGPLEGTLGTELQGPAGSVFWASLVPLVDQQAQRKCEQDPQPGGGQDAGSAQQVLGQCSVLRQQLPVLGLSEVGALLGLTAVVAILAGREVLDEQDAVGTLVPRLTTLLHIFLMAPRIGGMT